MHLQPTATARCRWESPTLHALPGLHRGRTRMGIASEALMQEGEMVRCSKCSGTGTTMCGKCNGAALLCRYKQAVITLCVISFALFWGHGERGCFGAEKADEGWVDKSGHGQIPIQCLQQASSQVCWLFACPCRRVGSEWLVAGGEEGGGRES